MTPPSAPPYASIITVNFNGLQHLVKFLPSIFASQADFELIIADNGSKDGSLEFISSHYPAVHIIPIGRNIGFSAANNKAAKLARGELLVFINPDTLVHPDWLLYLLKPFDDTTIGLTTAKILLMNNPERINTCGNLVHITGLVQCRGMGEVREHFSKPDDVAAVSGAAFAIRRSLFNILGGFDEEFFMYMEDTDLSCRARIAGWRCAYIPESLVWHDYTLRFGPNKVLYHERNRYRMLLKNLRWPTLIVLSPVYLLAEMITWGFVFSSDRINWKNKLRAYGETIIHRREILRKRYEVQRLRKIRDRDLLLLMGSNFDFFQIARSPVARWAAILFNPLFLLFRVAALTLVRW